MLAFITKNKVLVLGLGVVVLAMLYYLFFLSKPASAPLSTTADNESPVTRNLLVTLSNLHTIRLNGAIFADPVFVSLADFGVVIPTQSVGRRNPFAPMSAQGGASGGSAPAGPSITLPIPGR